MAEETTTKQECPVCGKPCAEGDNCCEPADKPQSKHDDVDAAAPDDGEDKTQPIPVMAEVLTAEGDTVPIATRWMRIGRETDNDIVVKDDGFVSRYHAWITYEREHFWLEDLGSTNGTLLNGEPLQRREILASGDKIKIGESEMTFVLLEKTGSGS